MDFEGPSDPTELTPVPDHADASNGDQCTAGDSPSSEFHSASSHTTTEGCCGALSFPTREPTPGQPLFAYAIHSSSDLRLGDHIVYQSSRPPFRIRFVSALIVGHQEENSVETITNGVVGVTKRTFHFTELKNLHGIKYDSCRYSEEESVERANARFRLKENCYHTLYNNSHFFVTWCKTGREYPLTDVLVEISQESVMRDDVLAPILFKSLVQSTTTFKLSPGDHVMFESQHYLIKSKNDNNTFSAYTVNAKNEVVLNTDLSFESILYSITCAEHCSVDCSHSLRQSEIESKSGTRWVGSDFFVAAMKCGTAHPIDVESMHIIDSDVTLTAHKLMPDDEINKGDHLVFNDLKNVTHSVLVYKCHADDHSRVLIKPPVDDSDIINITSIPEVFRIQYSDSLPTEEVLIRGKSKYGKQLIKKSLSNDHSIFVVWTKTGREIPLSAKFIRTSFKIESLQCTDFLKPGDHIVKCSDSYRSHFLVTEKRENSFFTVICCQPGGLVCETTIELDCEELYRIVYNGDFIRTDHEAVEIARHQVGQLKCSPWDQMLFIIQAKSSKDQRHIKVNTARTNSPISKTRIVSFLQLHLRDYLVIRPKIGRTTHCIVTNIDQEPPGAYTAIECHQGKVLKLHLTLPQSDVEYYRLNYKPGCCIASEEESIKFANSLLDKSFSTRNFIHFLKTAVENTEIRERTLEVQPRNHSTNTDCSSKSEITDVSQLCLGDYLVKETFFSPCHHYIITSISSSGTCTVVECFQGKILKAQVKLEVSRNVKYYRINYKPNSCLPVNESISKALMLADKSFVHHIKTGEEDIEIIEQSITMSQTITHNYLRPQYIKQVDSFNNICVGDHLIYSVTRPPYCPDYCSILVLEVNDDTEIEFITLDETGFVRKKLMFESMLNTGIVIYPCSSSEADVKTLADKLMQWKPIIKGITTKSSTTATTLLLE